MQCSELSEVWLLFVHAVRDFCTAENLHDKSLSIEKAEWNLGRLQTIVDTITPKSLPALDPVYLHQLKRFILAWESELEEIRKGRCDRQKQAVVNYLELEKHLVEDAIRHIEDATRPPGDQDGQERTVETKLPILGPVDVKILELLAKKSGVSHSPYDLLNIGDRKTIGQSLRHLRKIHYVAHPDGRKRGNVITADGLTRLQSLAETSP